MIYDDAGYIAGVQSVLLESDVDMAYNDLTKQVGDEFLNTIFLCRKELKIQITMKIFHSQCTFKTCGWGRLPGSPPPTLSTHSSSATEEGCYKTIWRKLKNHERELK